MSALVVGEPRKTGPGCYECGVASKVVGLLALTYAPTPELARRRAEVIRKALERDEAGGETERGA